MLQDALLVVKAKKIPSGKLQFILDAETLFRNSLAMILPMIEVIENVYHIAGRILITVGDSYVRHIDSNN